MRARSRLVRMPDEFYLDLVRAQKKLQAYEKRQVSLMETQRRLARRGWLAIPKAMEAWFG